MATKAFHIDDDENSDWLHSSPVRFNILKDGRAVGSCNIESEKIKTSDSELEEFFYLLIDEGIDNGPIGKSDGQEFMDVMKRAGYEARPVSEATDAFDARLEAENWDFQGLKIDIENLRGSVRHGRTHHTYISAPYGYIKGTVGADGDEVDVFVGAVLTAPYAFVIHTKDPQTNKYDEDKVILGCESATEAKKLFDENYDRDGFFESMERMSIEELKSKLKTLRGKKITAS